MAGTGMQKGAVGAIVLGIILAGLGGCRTTPQSPSQQGRTRPPSVAVIDEAVDKIQASCVEAIDRSVLIQRAIDSMDKAAQARGYRPSSTASGDQPSKKPSLKETFHRLVRDANMPPDQLIAAALDGMLQGVKSPSRYIPAGSVPELPTNPGAIGIEIKRENDWPVVVKTLDGGPAARSQILPGDRIVRLGGESTQGWSLVDTVKRLVGPVGSSVALEVEREGLTQPFSVQLTREAISPKTVLCKDVGGDIVYVAMTTVSENTPSELQKAIHYRKGRIPEGIILDLRGNEGGPLVPALRICDFFLGHRTKLITVSTRFRDMPAIAESGPAKVGVPIVVLVDRNTASGAEVIAGALQYYHRATVVGEPTGGLGNVRTIERLSNGARMFLTSGWIVLPSGRRLQDNPIEPDVRMADDGKGSLVETVRNALQQASGLPPESAVARIKETLGPHP
jgi:carboxyl-terminal processing protease